MTAFSMNSIPSQAGKVAIVTGANVGLGYETTRALAKKDYLVIMACRNRHKAEAAMAKIKTEYANAKLECMILDLSKQRMVHDFAKQFIREHQQLHLLINNAGIMMPPFQLTEDGFESQMATNYFGHFTLTGLMLPTLENTNGSRIVTLSSLAHAFTDMDYDDINFKQHYSARAAYGQSKLACLMFAYELQRRLSASGYQTQSLAAHPGISITSIGRHIHPILLTLGYIISPILFQKPKKAALPILMAALDPHATGGSYYGPGGFRQYKGAPKKVGSNKNSRDESKARRLWDVSQELTGLKYL